MSTGVTDFCNFIVSIGLLFYSHEICGAQLLLNCINKFESRAYVPLHVVTVVGVGAYHTLIRSDLYENRSDCKKWSDLTAEISQYPTIIVLMNTTSIRRMQSLNVVQAWSDRPSLSCRISCKLDLIDQACCADWNQNQIISIKLVVQGWSDLISWASLVWSDNNQRANITWTYVCGELALRLIYM